MSTDGLAPTSRRVFVAGNWKMNLDHIQTADFAAALASRLTESAGAQDVDVAVFPPFTGLRSLQALTEEAPLPFDYGAQDVSAFDAAPTPARSRACS
jgi:triosephosphate isomerase